MQAAIEQGRAVLAEICRRHGVAKLEVFGSAAAALILILAAATFIF